MYKRQQLNVSFIVYILFLVVKNIVNATQKITAVICCLLLLQNRWREWSRKWTFNIVSIYRNIYLPLNTTAVTLTLQKIIMHKLILMETKQLINSNTQTCNPLNVEARASSPPVYVSAYVPTMCVNSFKSYISSVAHKNPLSSLNYLFRESLFILITLACVRI